MTGNTKQFSTFFIGDRMYGIDVMKVQEVTKSLVMTKIPMAPEFVYGLINLRGQIATAIGLSDLFEISEKDNNEKMNVICNIDGLLLSLQVDRIGDVVYVEEGQFEPTPETISPKVRRFMEGVYKLPGALLSVIEVDKLSKFIQKVSSEN